MKVCLTASLLLSGFLARSMKEAKYHLGDTMEEIDKYYESVCEVYSLLKRVENADYCGDYDSTNLICKECHYCPPNTLAED